MSHDVDWPKHGPGKSHILARGDRFDSSVIDRVSNEGYNPTSLQMKGGRKYSDVLKYLMSRDDVMIKRGCDVIKTIERW